MSAHPAPWIVGFVGFNACSIYDSNNVMVESVYGREGDPTGETLARRIVDAVNNFQPRGLGNEGTSDMGGNAHSTEKTEVTETTTTEKAAAFPTLDDEKTVTETTTTVEKEETA